MKKYTVRLSTEERETLTKLITSGRGPARMFTRGRILLKADQSDNGPGWSDERISEALDVTVQTIERVRKQLVEEGFDRFYPDDNIPRKFLAKRLTVMLRHIWLLFPAVSRREAGSDGHCACWQIRLWNLDMWKAFPMKRFARH